MQKTSTCLIENALRHLVPHAIVLLILATDTFGYVKRIAFVVGANNGLSTERPLKYAESDAERVGRVLQELGRVNASHNYVLLNPSKNDIVHKMYEISGRIKEVKEQGGKAVLFFYYSGHGGGGEIHVNGSRIGIEELIGPIKKSDADLKVLVIDACYSGAFVRAKGGKVAPAIDVAFDEEMTARGTIVLTSSSADQVSHESEELQGSVFTHFYVSGLRGAADENADGVVSLTESFQFARNQTSRESARSVGTIQKPLYQFDFTGSAQIDLTWLDQGACQLKLSGGKADRHLLYSKKTLNVVAEFVPKGDTITLALPRDKYFINRVNDRDIGFTEIDLLWKKQLAIDLGTLRKYPRAALASKGGPLYDPNMHRVAVFSHAFPSYPENSLLITSGIAYRFSSGQWGSGLKVGFGNDQIKGPYGSVRRSITVIGANLDRHLVSYGILSVISRVEGGAQGIRQVESREARPDLSEKSQTAWVPYGEITTGLAIDLMWRLNLAVNGGVGYYHPNIRNQGGSSYLRPVVEFSLRTDF